MSITTQTGTKYEFIDKSFLELTLYEARFESSDSQTLKHIRVNGRSRKTQILRPHPQPKVPE